MPKAASYRGLDNAGRRTASGWLRLLSDAFERAMVGLLVHEPTRPGVALHEALGVRVEDLTPLTHSTVTTTVTSWGIRCHLTSPPFTSMNPSTVDDVL